LCLSDGSIIGVTPDQGHPPELAGDPIYEFFASSIIADFEAVYELRGPVQSGGISQISGMIRIMIRDALSFYEFSELYSIRNRA
jgi:hypothetical protein